ncbi:heptaprenyl diphosphate synthase component 1 [Paenibacillus sacheonensis]|uniref:Heptaprenyl diphosphate synthase component 1 n=1 Tax=Paenibacillus sacheonensis TaxID=742054 RepID=A0A7X5C098_9BACL|nr:heptaprenyl diphosphate synthase component 1 [Paenibacillus sacheonensis]MBM7564485.1 heptaprenyl diphosphate synthase [Paenibacillus sacheonensis]NBC69045.1 heptaprenyl diphosphate synthase component 1 [Paenibacillus sacheonensis]
MKPYRIPEIAKKYVEYDMIQAHTELPDFPDARARLLFAFLSNQRTPLLHSELYALVVSLVQLGMDTHDMIDESGRLAEKEMRSRQLKILAGDYYSSRFYQLLAQAGQVGMIKRISNGVCEVNKLKVNFYMRMKQLKLNAEDYLNQCVQLKTELFTVFTEIMDEKMTRIWTELLQGLGRCEVLMDELIRSDKPERFSHSWGYWHVLGVGTDEEKRKLEGKPLEPSFAAALLSAYDIRGQLSAKISQSVSQVQAIAARLDSEKLMRELQQIGETFLRPLLPAASALNDRR